MEVEDIQSKVREMMATLKASETSESSILENFGHLISQLYNCEYREFRPLHLALVYELQSHEIDGLGLVLKFSYDRLKTLAEIDTYNLPELVYELCGKGKFWSFFTKTVKMNKKAGRVSTFVLPKITKKEAFQYQAWLQLLLEEGVSTPIGTDVNGDVAHLLLMLSFYRALAHKTNNLDKFYYLSDSVMDRLVRDHCFQQARDISEEILLCSYRDESKIYGHWCRMNLHSRSSNPVESVLNCCLMLEAVQATSAIPSQNLYGLIKGSLIAFRNCGLLSEISWLIDKANDLDGLSAYDRDGLAVLQINDQIRYAPELAIITAEQYAEANMEAIFNSARPAIESWLAVICNLLNYDAQLLHKNPSLNKVYSAAESILGSSHVKMMQSRILQGQHGTKDFMLGSLHRLRATRNKLDHIHEINLLQLTAGNLISNSIASNDPEGVLIGHLIKSDGSIAFKLSEALGAESLVGYVGSKTLPAADDYYSYCSELVASSYGIKYIWIGEVNGQLYRVEFINGEWVINVCPEGVYASWVRWLKEDLPDIGFDDSPRVGLFESREDVWQDQSAEFKSSLPAAIIEPQTEDVVIFADISLSTVPHNLLAGSSGKLLSVCNSLTADLYRTYSDCQINLGSLSIWAPIAENDTAIGIAHSELSRVFSANSFVHHTNTVPPLEDNSDIRVFVCHGGRRGEGGFTGLYPSREKSFTTTHIFGSGKLAVLFVCHGGHVHPQLYARSISALVKTLILDGYQAVVAPAWSLNIMIPAPWLSAFTGAMKDGMTISQSVRAANTAIQNLFPVESAWAAMHLFGNPHLKA